ncbi:MAG: hypothetical protein RO257_13895 [Candidatus Kapabacteria bacterium]|nr:hypothetical protein [Candidatus Kapabacteria bacterium]
MKRIINILLISIILGFLITQNLNCQSFKNTGAGIFLNGNVFVKVVNLEVKNDDGGEIIIREASQMRVENADFINESGTLVLSDISLLRVSKNLINKDMFNNESSSHTEVIQNGVNSGFIYNESIIEIGE